MRIFEPSKSHRAPSIRLINLVDVLFILLIFFIATTTFRSALPTAVKLQLPEAKTSEELGKEKITRLVISINADETVFVDDKPAQIDAIGGILRDAKQKNPAVQVQFSADKKVSYGTVMAVVDAARAAGVNNITAFTKRSLESSAAP
jgi:biopolymer transport protein ExbD